MQVNKFGLVLQNLVTPNNKKLLSLQHVSMDLIRAVTVESKLSNDDNLHEIKEERIEGKKLGYCKLCQAIGNC